MPEKLADRRDPYVYRNLELFAFCCCRFIRFLGFRYSIPVWFLNHFWCISFDRIQLASLTRTVEESLQAVHYTQREAGLALGLSRWETVIKVVVPEATPGILTGVILSSGRIFGEAAALIYTAGQSAPALDFTNWNPLSVSSPISIFRQAETLAVHIWKINTEGTMPDGVSVSAGASAVLIIAVLLFNFGARAIGKRLYRKMTSA